MYFLIYWIFFVFLFVALQSIHIQGKKNLQCSHVIYLRVEYETWECSRYVPAIISTYTCQWKYWRKKDMQGGMEPVQSLFKEGHHRRSLQFTN